MDFNTKRLPVARDDVAPDGSDVRLLLGLKRGGMGGSFSDAPVSLLPRLGSLILLCRERQSNNILNLILLFC